MSCIVGGEMHRDLQVSGHDKDPANISECDGNQHVTVAGVRKKEVNVF